MNEPLTHLLRPGEYRTWCRPHDVPGSFGVTTLPSKCTCANCLTVYRRTIANNPHAPEFRVKHVAASRKQRAYE